LSQPKPIEPILGTDALGRPLTRAERAYAAHLLRAHDIAGASLVALRFAYTKTRNMAAAQDVMGRVKLRLLQQGWDPNRVTLVKCLCRFVYCEWVDGIREAEREREAEKVFLRDREETEGSHAPSVEEYAARLDDELRAEASAKERLAELRAAFVAAKDEVNLLWLEQKLAGQDDASEMAKRTGRDVTEFYRAADRRKRHVERLLAARADGKPKEDE
jgi:hypothetical protein